MGRFKNKVAVITGAASGIGHGIVNRAVKEEMRLVLADIEEKALMKVEKELNELGTDFLTVITDVSKQKDIEELANKTIDKFGEVNLLFNNAGVAPTRISWEASLEDWKWIMDVNLWGVIHGCRSFIPIMIQQNNECHIVNTASLSGLMANEMGQGMYIVTKYGVIGLTEILEKELSMIKSKIKIHALCPGMVRTNIMDCERNRPTELCVDQSERVVHPELEQIEEAIAQMTEIGTSPDKVGDIVFEGIKADLFYILTDTKLYLKRMIKDRMTRILDAYSKNKQIHKSI
ncbi:MAG: SDR family NAD(P)-dependent oxidoreductase [Candidatus Lokiarchaeota archaeon]|nr:SDR family NAD(P)-dependent oxidoreductase [Candidatus Lokiarchaeota archaeon]